MEQYSNSATRQLFNAGGGFGRWIKSTISALVDDLAGSGGVSSAKRAMVVVSGEGSEIHVRGGQAGRHLAARSAGGLAGLTLLLQRELKGAARHDILLRIGAGMAVSRRVSLPGAALEVLPAVVRNKVESLAPWPLAEVLWGHRIADRSQPGLIEVEVGIVSRKTVDGLLAALREGGASVRYLEVASMIDEGENITIDFLGSGRAGKVRRIVMGAMSVAIVLALGVAAYGVFLAVTAQTQVWAAEQRIADLQQSLLGGRSGGVMNARLREANALYERKKEMLPVVIVLDALTRSVPDGTWLTAIDYAENRITIAGKSSEVAKVIESLDSSDVFAQVNFASATQRDADLDADTFSLSATVEPKVSKP